jgi:hypothetical protein
VDGWRGSQVKRSDSQKKIDVDCARGGASDSYIELLHMKYSIMVKNNGYPKTCVAS